ncbi:MAG TPA: hypothetical protein VMM81_06055 [Acidimicrobiia bacterium]|nr:hypothetical protein [Acidimicrobiia bacterium]
MARPTRYATRICLAVTVLAALGILLGIRTGEVIYPVVFLVPAVAYSVYRTEGASTTWASWLLAVLTVALIVVTIFSLSYDLSELFGTDRVDIVGEQVPLGDVSVVFPAAMGALGVVLFTRTRGVYTRWLAAVIFVGSAAVVWMTAPGLLVDLLRRVGLT